MDRSQELDLLQADALQLIEIIAFTAHALLTLPTTPNVHTWDDTHGSFQFPYTDSGFLDWFVGNSTPDAMVRPEGALLLTAHDETSGVLVEECRGEGNGGGSDEAGVERSQPTV